MSAQVWIAILIGSAAVIEDLWRRNISNWTSAAALVSGFAWQVSNKGWSGFGTAAAGAAAGFGVFLIFYLLGGMGGGDVKLMSGFGALLGAGRLLEAALFTALIGGLLAGAVIGFASLRAWLRKETTPAQPKAIPYAPAIAAGVWLSLVPR